MGIIKQKKVFTINIFFYIFNRKMTKNKIMMMIMTMESKEQDKKKLKRIKMNNNQLKMSINLMTNNLIKIESEENLDKETQ